MSSYYNPKRGAGWNFGGKNWRLSRSKIDLFMECPRCFYIDNKMGTKRPPGFPFNLNSAVDHLLKKEFDSHRADQTPHPLMEENNLDLVPFAHKDMDIWRDNFQGVETQHEPTGMTISGAVDDIWVDKNGVLYVVDYKSTSKDDEVNIDAEWQIGYKRQMEVYQWLLRQNGFEVSDTGYFVYANAIKDKPGFDNKLEFDIKVIPYTGKGEWIEKVLESIHKCLMDHRIPKAHDNCDYCRYHDALNDAENSKKESPSQNTLF